MQALETVQATRDVSTPAPALQSLAAAGGLVPPGDAGAGALSLAEAYRQWHQEVVGYIAARLPVADCALGAEDLAQQVWLDCLAHWRRTATDDGVPNSGALRRAMLFTAVQWRIVDELRRRRRRSALGAGSRLCFSSLRQHAGEDSPERGIENLLADPDPLVDAEAVVLVAEGARERVAGLARHFRHPAQRLMLALALRGYDHAGIAAALRACGYSASAARINVRKSLWRMRRWVATHDLLEDERPEGDSIRTAPRCAQT